MNNEESSSVMAYLSVVAIDTAKQVRKAVRKKYPSEDAARVIVIVQHSEGPTVVGGGGMHELDMASLLARTTHQVLEAARDGTSVSSEMNEED